MHIDYHIEPSFSLRPNKLVLYNRFYKSDKVGNYKTKLNKENSLANLKRNFHKFSISENAKRNLKSKINWLYFMAKEKKILTYSKKTIFNFKISFITLTLPSKQMHPSSVITKQVFNQFLTEIRKRTGMVNYVWRLEFQKNKNVHYHLVTDTYIDYFLIQEVWNRVLNKLGYVDRYTEKHKKLSFKQYFDKNNSNGKADFDLIKKRYIKGVKNKWAKPNSVDVRSVVGGKNIAGYISKYFSKDKENSSVCNVLDNEQNSKNIRLWFCSRSLSKLDKIADSVSKAPFNLFEVISKIKDVFIVKAEYCTILFFDFKKGFCKHLLKIKNILYDYARAREYNSKQILI